MLIMPRPPAAVASGQPLFAGASDAKAPSAGAVTESYAMNLPKIDISRIPDLDTLIATFGATAMPDPAQASVPDLFLLIAIYLWEIDPKVAMGAGLF